MSRLKGIFSLFISDNVIKTLSDENSKLVVYFEQ